MTWSRTLTTGDGKTAYRLSIEGMEYEFVTSSAMARTLSDGRTRVNGLQRAGLEDSEKLDLTKATVDAGHFSAKVADIDGKATLLFKRSPTKRTWLQANLSVTGTSATVASSTGWVIGDFVYIGTEVTKVSAVPDATHLTLVNAGTRTPQWDTVAQAHYVATGGTSTQNLAYPSVTNQPLTIAGRRAKLYAYGEGDDPQGDGTLIWIGRCAGSARLDSVSTWSIPLESIVSILNQDLGADLADPVTPRGIYFPWCSPVVFYFELSNSSSITGSTSASATISLVGFFEDNAKLVADINTKIAASVIAGWSTTVRAQVTESGWQFAMTTASAGQKAIRIYMNANYTEQHQDPAFFVTASGATRDVVNADETVYKRFIAPVPRGVYGRPRDLPSGVVETDAATYPETRIYLGGSFIPDSFTTAAVVDWPGRGTVQHRLPATNPYDATARWVNLVNRPDPDAAPPARTFVAYGASGVPSIRFGRSWAYGDIDDFISALITASPTYMNTGSVPDLRAGDFDTTAIATTAAEASAGSVFLSDRDYTAFSSKKLAEILASEAQIRGCYWCRNSSGQLTLKRLSVPGIGDASRSIGASSVLSFPSMEIEAYGSINTIRCKTGYDALNDRYNGPSITFRHVPAFSASKIVQAIDISPVFESYRAPRVQDIAAVLARSATGLFALLGNPYDIVDIEVPVSAMTIRAGDVITLTNAQLPNSSGTRGITSKPCLVIGRSFDLDKGRGTLTLLCSSGRAKGYAPAMRVESAANVAGNQWDLTLTGAPPTSGSVNTVPDFAPNASSWYAAGDKVRMWQWDSAAPTVRVGTVDSCSGAIMRVTFTAAWVGLAGLTYYVSYNVASTAGLQTGQQQYAFMAGTDLVVDFTAPDAAAEMGA